MNNLLQSLKEKCEFHKDINYLLGVSGGLDSMFLLYSFHQLNLPIEVAHINYQLRGQESDLDALLVEDFCSKNKIPFHLKNINLKEYLEKKGGNLQAIAREVRYSFFNEILIGNHDNNITKIPEYFLKLFDFEHRKSRSELDILTEIYKILDQNLKK